MLGGAPRNKGIKKILYRGPILPSVYKRQNIPLTLQGRNIVHDVLTLQEQFLLYLAQWIIMINKQANPDLKNKENHSRIKLKTDLLKKGIYANFFADFFAMSKHYHARVLTTLTKTELEVFIHKDFQAFAQYVLINEIKDTTSYDTEKLKDENYNSVTVQYIKQKDKSQNSASQSVAEQYSAEQYSAEQYSVVKLQRNAVEKPSIFKEREQESQQREKYQKAGFIKLLILPVDIVINGTVIMPDGRELDKAIKSIKSIKGVSARDKIDEIIELTRFMIPESYFMHLIDESKGRNDPDNFDKFITKKDLLFNYEEDYAVNWVCKWTDKVSSKVKYFLFAGDSELAQEGEMLKYEMSHYLSKNKKRFIKYVKMQLESSDLLTVQYGVILYIVYHLGLRAGSETNDETDVKDTTKQVVGVSTLFTGNISLNLLDVSKRHVMLDFIGKDSIPYQGGFVADAAVFDYLLWAKKTREREDRLFDIQYKDVITRLKDFHQDMTMKSIRTYRITREFCKLALRQIEINPLESFNDNNDDNSNNKGNDKDGANNDEDSNNSVMGIDKSHLRLLKTQLDFVFEQVAVFCNHVTSILKKDIAAGVAKVKENIIAVRDSIKSTKNKKQTESTILRLELLAEQLDRLQYKKTYLEKGFKISTATSKTNYIDPRCVYSMLNYYGVKGDIAYSKVLIKKFVWAEKANNFFYD